MFAIVASMAPTVLGEGQSSSACSRSCGGVDFAFRVRARHGVRYRRRCCGSWRRSIPSATCGTLTSTRRPVSSPASPPASRLPSGRLRRQPVHAGDLLRGAQPRDLSARLPPRGRRRDGGQPQVPRLSDGRVEERASAALALTYHLRVARLRGGGIAAGVDASAALLTVVYFCYLFGFAKAAVMPMHAWLPAAMVAPTPVSASACGGRGQDGRSRALW